MLMLDGHRAGPRRVVDRARQRADPTDAGGAGPAGAERSRRPVPSVGAELKRRRPLPGVEVRRGPGRPGGVARARGASRRPRDGPRERADAGPDRHRRGPLRDGPPGRAAGRPRRARRGLRVRRRDRLPEPRDHGHPDPRPPERRARDRRGPPVRGRDRAVALPPDDRDDDGAARLGGRRLGGRRRPGPPRDGRSGLRPRDDRLARRRRPRGPRPRPARGGAALARGIARRRSRDGGGVLHAHAPLGARRGRSGGG